MEAIWNCYCSAAATVVLVVRDGALRLLQRHGVDAAEGVAPPARQRRRACGFLGREEGEDASQRGVTELSQAVLSPAPPPSGGLHHARHDLAPSIDHDLSRSQIRVHFLFFSIQTSILIRFVRVTKTRLYIQDSCLYLTTLALTHIPSHY